MTLDDLIRQDAILPALRANSKKQALQELSRKAAELTGLEEREIFETVMNREKLGTTGVGNGIAIPHGKLAELDRIVGVFARLPRAIDFEAIDEEPVDLVFLLLAPSGAGAEHLKALSKIARILRSPETVAALREARDTASMFALMRETSAAA